MVSGSRRSRVIAGVVALLFGLLMLAMVPSLGADRELDERAAAGQGDLGDFRVDDLRCRRFAGCVPHGTWTGADGATAPAWWRAQAGEPEPAVGDVVPARLLWRGEEAVVYPASFTAGAYTWDARRIAGLALGGLAVLVAAGFFVAAARRPASAQ
ncbi:MAG: hypothetical protein QM713_15855 [Arachnia sp.]